MLPDNTYTDPSGCVYVEPFVDEAEEAAWIEQEKRIMAQNQERSETLRLAA